MIKRTRIAGLVGAGALLLGMMLASTGAVSADGQITWTGQGTHLDGDNLVLNTEQCDESNTAYLLWVFTPGGNDSITGGTLHLGGSGSGDYAIALDGQWKATTPFFDLDTLTATLDYTGDLGSGESNLVISHGCAGTTETPTPPVETPSFGQSFGDITDAPSEPTTDSLGTQGTSGPADGAWLLVVALGVLLASIVVLTPARAKSRR